ncbi:MAG: hypothetical protein ABI197_07830 [Granulicella sp.]
MRMIVALAMVLAIAGTTGCNIETHGRGDNKNVKIATPFGGMQVRTNEAVVVTGIGVPVYPGSTIVKKDKGDDGAVDLNMSFGSFQMKVKAASYRTPDTPEKVLGFYKKELARFGSVIQCLHDRPVGMPTHTDEGLTCQDDDHHDGDQVNLDKGDLNDNGNDATELKVGSKRRRHVVELHPDGAGTKFGLVLLELPGDFHSDSGDKGFQSEGKQ